MNGARPTVSVVICVYTADRWADILAAVDSVRGQSLPAHETLLVVDHNPDLLDRLTRWFRDTGAAGAAPGRAPASAGGRDPHAPNGPGVPRSPADPGAGEQITPAGEVLVMPNTGPRGLSAGRNTGIAATSGSIIAFLDDDAVAEPDWLAHLAAAYADPRVLAVGGRTVPAWASGRRPAWFPEEFDWVVGCTYRGLPPGKVPVRNVLGGNASFRREAFAAAGGFATGIGRDGDSLPMGCEETELCIRLARARPDALLLIDDRAVIHHKVPEERERFAYFRSRAWAEGLSKALVARQVGSRAGLATERRYTTRVLPAGIARGLRDALCGRLGGAGRAGAIAVGVTAAAAGYARGRLRARRFPVRLPATGETAGSGPAAAAPPVEPATAPTRQAR